MKTVKPLPSDCTVRARDLRLFSTAGVDEAEASSESDSGTGSRCSFFKEQVHRRPWLQQHESAMRTVSTLPFCDLTTGPNKDLP